jgi:DNA-binding helix-hairpin-helix protein with protein kinase domain
MAKTLLTSQGVPIQIGRELGKGGEGFVFEVPSLPNQVAKLYHRLPDAKKQAKLTFMANTADQQLLNYVAWPQATLHSSKGGPIVGFLMPKVTGKDPIHMIYSPAHRRQERPMAAWNFLLYVARNAATAFEALHAHGHVLGDVNQGNVMVGGDSKVTLIDSDSFQVNANGNIHLCEVGVSHFTAPELQGLSSFQGFTRTTNHDNFGLALLIFHLLFGGRHPYSGVPLRSGVGDALESDIKGFKYAYARDAQSRGIAPPPRSIELSMVPDTVESMFHKAFTEKGAAGGRPTPKQWETALDGLRKNLKKCNSSSVHVYPDHSNKCPWCALEQQGIIYFVDLGATYTATATGFVLAQAWAFIDAVPVPPVLNIPNINNISVIAAPLPANIPRNGTITAYRILVVILALVAFAAFPKAFLFVALAAWAGWAGAASVGSKERQAERTKRSAAMESARHEFEAIVEKVKKGAGPEGFHAKKDALRKLRDEFQTLPAEEKKELDNLQSTGHARQKQKFLERFFIDSADISGVGAARKSTLRSFGIETAADVTRHRILQVKGFGESLTRSITDWKASCERRFVFNPAAAVSEADKNTIKAKFGARKSALAASLGGGAAELERFRQTATSKAISLQPSLDQAARKLAQAKSDLALL